MKTLNTPRFLVVRTVIAGCGISAEIELSAPDAATAEQVAAAHFSHEPNVQATYTVQTCLHPVTRKVSR